MGLLSAGSPEPALCPTTPPPPSDLSRPARLPSVAGFDGDLASTMTTHAYCRTPAGLNHWPHTPLLILPPLPGPGVAASPLAAFRSSSNFSTDSPSITDGLPSRS